MKETKSTVIFAVVIAALVLVFQYVPVCTMAQEQGSATQASEPQPTAKPEASQPAAQPSEPQPTAKPAESKPAEPAAEKKAEKEKPKELTNLECMDCHNPDMLKMSKEELAEQVTVDDKPMPPRAKPPFISGELNLAIKEKKYAEGVHADTTCVACHKDVVEVPHNQRLKSVDCKECHEEFVDNVQASAHSEKVGPKSVGCIGCHDVHYGKPKGDYEKSFSPKVCEECHKAYNMDTLKAHKNIYEPKLHLALNCMLCHSGDQPGVHNIPAVKTKVAKCESCHTKKSLLSKEKPAPVSFSEYIAKTGFINEDALKKYGYVLGAHRIPALDLIIILAVIAPFGLPIVHGGLRILTRRKEPIHLPEEKILLHPLVERLWHWVQALCIVMLIITGVMLHWPEKFPGWFDWSVTLHNWFGWGAVIGFLVWLVYNLGTGRISHYIPTKEDIPMGMIRQARFYGYGIFKHEPHPYAPSEDNKFNPLQKIAYFQFQALLFPILLISGILYMYPETFKGIIAAIGGMYVLAIIHLILGGLFAAFLVAHLYLATTGETIGENFKAIIFGYGIKADHDEHGHDKH